MLVLLILVVSSLAEAGENAKPEYSANTDIQGHETWGEHAKGDPSGPVTEDSGQQNTEVPAVLASGLYRIKNLYGCDGESAFPSGGTWQCDKYVGKLEEYVALHSDTKPVWEVIRLEAEQPVYIIRTYEQNKWNCLYWFDNPRDDGDWLALSEYRDTVWHIMPRGQGWKIRAAHRCTSCKKDMTWKGAGVSWKYLYVGDDEGINFAFEKYEAS